MANTTRKTEREKGKVTRVPFGGPRYKLQLSDADEKYFKEKGYVLRWINDQDGRIPQALAGGYEYVKPEEAPSLGSGAIHEGNSDIGSVVSKIVSKGEYQLRAYLMKIKKRFYDEDQREKNKALDKIEADLQRGQAGGAKVENQYGPGVTYSR